MRLSKKVLVLGYRKKLILELQKRNFEVWVWNPKKIKTQSDICWVIKPFPQTLETAQKNVLKFGLLKVNFVIGAVEKSVVSAAILRKYFKLKDQPFVVYLRCSDKLLMKRFLVSKNIAMTPFYFASIAPKDLQKTKSWVIKCRKESGGFRTVFTQDKKEILQALQKRLLVEKRIYGTECSVESYIQNKKIVFSNITQYLVKGKCNVVPAVFSKSLESKIKRLNEQIVQALEIQWGMTHAEFYIVKSQNILFGEIAIRPPGGYIMNLIEKSYGFDPWKAFVDIQTQKRAVLPQKNRKNASVVLLTSKEGKVLSIAGIDWISQKNTVEGIHTKVKKGDWVPARNRLGEDLGFAMLSSQSKKKLMRDTHLAIEKIQIKVKVQS